jgi:hypothetical protein
MASKRRLSLDAKINRPTRTVEKGFAAVAQDLALRPTKSELASIVENIITPIVDAKLKPITDELVSIRGHLKYLKEKAAEAVHLTKEIDHALERIRRIEKHLGIQNEIPA